MYFSFANTIRLLTFQNPVRQSFQNSPRAALIALGVMVLLRIAMQAMIVWPIGGFEFWAIPYFSTVLLIELVGLLGILALFGRRVSSFQVIVAYAMCHIVYNVLISIAYRTSLTDGWETYHYYLAYLAFLVVFLVRLPAFARGARWGLSVSLAAVAILKLALALPFANYAYLFQPVYEDVAENSANEPSIDVESLYYAQSDLVAKQLEQLDLDAKPSPQLFAILGAGTAYQRVFIREVKSISAILSEQFGQDTPRLHFANSNSEPYRYPLANRPNIETALRHTAETMDQSKDIALLYLTSHGGKDRFSLSFFEASTVDLTATEMNAILDRSGITNIVIILSACYSGSFIDDISTPDRAVFTAADANSTSFGCSDESEWTWFGDAFFNNALRETHDFVEAFEIAKQLVTKWEIEHEYEPSQPQMEIGSEIAPLLSRLAASYSDRQAALSEQ